MSFSSAEPKPTPAMSAIIITYNAGDDLGLCIGSLLTQGRAIEIVVVDNGSRDGSVERARADYPEIHVLSDGVNDGFAGGANRGAAAASGEVLLFLNPDVVLEPGCADALLITLDRSARPTVCAPVLVDPVRQLVEYGFTIDYAGDLVGLTSPTPPLYLSGCALATTRRVFTELGGFDSAFFMLIEDVDFCWRALLHGFDVRVVDAARVRHRGGGSTPGGYVRSGRIEVTAFRIALRERNTLATLVRCGPIAWLALVVPLRLVRMGAMAVIAIPFGRGDLALALGRAVAWNVRRLPELVRQRRAMPATPGLRRQVLQERMLRDVNSVRVLLRHGLPRFADRPESDSARARR